MLVVTVPQMHCRHDVRRISACLADVAGVVALQVDLDSKTVLVDGDVTAAAVRAAIAAAGYGVTE